MSVIVAQGSGRVGGEVIAGYAQGESFISRGQEARYYIVTELQTRFSLQLTKYYNNKNLFVYRLSEKSEDSVNSFVCQPLIYWQIQRELTF